MMILRRYWRRMLVTSYRCHHSEDVLKSDILSPTSPNSHWGLAFNKIDIYEKLRFHVCIFVIAGFGSSEYWSNNHNFGSTHQRTCFSWSQLSRFRKSKTNEMWIWCWDYRGKCTSLSLAYSRVPYRSVPDRSVLQCSEIPRHTNIYSKSKHLI